MADGFRQRTDLRVEGKDDEKAIASLLAQNGFQQEKEKGKSRDVEIKAAEENDAGFGRGKLLEVIKTAAEAARDRAVGFVIDAEADANATWDAVRHKLNEVEHLRQLLPAACPAEGLILNVTSVSARIGVWIMPDNAQPGMLENFLETLIRAGDPIITIASAATDQAKNAGAKFSNEHHKKAILHAWLAWQEKTGLPYGTALTARYFDPHAASAQAFLNWIDRLIG